VADITINTWLQDAIEAAVLRHSEKRFKESWNYDDKKKHRVRAEIQSADKYGIGVKCRELGVIKVCESYHYTAQEALKILLDEE
jgi:hypothetical protein